MLQTAIINFLPLSARFSTVPKLFLIAVFLSVPVSCQKTETKKSPSVVSSARIQKPQTTDGFYDIFSGKPVNLNVGLSPIRRVSETQKFSRAESEKYRENRRRYLNEELNSRTSQAMAENTWKLKWKADLPSSSFRPTALLSAPNRIVVESEGLWTLFDGDGKKIIHGPLGASVVFLDEKNFYAADSTGLIEARSLFDGADVFALSLYFGGSYERRFMTRRGNKFLAVSTEREPHPEIPDRSENSLVELVDLGAEPLKTDDDGILQSAKKINSLARKTKILLAAVSDETLVLATQNRFYRAGLNLSVTEILTGDFTPLAVSLDEDARIYAVVERKKKRFVWILLPGGGLNAEIELPASFGSIVQPPVVGFDHRIYIVADNAILAVDETGKMIWMADTAGVNSGAIVTATGRLLVSSGNELLAFDAAGNKKSLFGFTGRQLQTAPLLTAAGEILVASRDGLFCLQADR